MSELLETLKYIVIPIHLPLTILVALSFGYWIFVLVGALDIEALNLDFDLDFDGDDAAAGGDAEASPDAAHGNWFAHVASFLNLADVPLMVVLSILAFSVWAISLLLNVTLNPNSNVLLALALLIPNLIASAWVTRVLTTPVKRIFETLESDQAANAPVVGSVCTIVTETASEAFGQATIEAKGAPITINVRTTRGLLLRRGQRGLVIEEAEHGKFYQIIEYNEPQLEN